MEVTREEICENTRSVLVTLLKGRSVVLNKSMLPKCVHDKELAWEHIKTDYMKTTGKFVTIDQLKKLLQNMRTAVKKKTDTTATGNKPVKLLSWEREFLDLLHSNENPVFQKVPGAVAVGVDKEITPSNVDSSFVEDPDDPEEPTVSRMKRAVSETSKGKVKKLKIPCETEDTAKYTTTELQRWLLLEQIKLTQLQVKREELLLSNEQNNQQIIAIEGGGDGLAEFVVLRNNTQSEGN